MNVTAESLNRTVWKGWPEGLIAVVTAVVVILSENVASLPLGPESAVVVGLVLQLALQALRRLGRDAKTGVPPSA